MKREPPTISVGRLRQALALYHDDDLLSFGGLEYARIKSRGEHLAQVEFNELVFLDAAGRVVVQNHD